MAAEERKFVAKMVVLEPITKRFTARQHRSASLQQPVPVVAHYAVHACPSAEDQNKERMGQRDVGQRSLTVLHYQQQS